jgi:hypothetical protein
VILPFEWERPFGILRASSTSCAEATLSVPSTGLSKDEVRRRPINIGHNRGPPLDPLTVTVAEARRITGLGLTTIWALIAKKEVDSVLVGRRRLVMFASLRRLLTPQNDDQIMQERSAAARRLTAKRRRDKPPREATRPNASRPIG